MTNKNGIKNYLLLNLLYGCVWLKIPQVGDFVWFSTAGFPKYSTVLESSGCGDYGNHFAPWSHNQQVNHWGEKIFNLDSRKSSPMNKENPNQLARSKKNHLVTLWRNEMIGKKNWRLISRAIFQDPVAILLEWISLACYMLTLYT